MISPVVVEAVAILELKMGGNEQAIEGFDESKASFLNEESKMLLKVISSEEMQQELKKWPSLKQIWSELRKQRHIGAPIAVMNLLWFAKFIISTMFLGQLGDLQLAGGALAITFANVTGFSLLMGLAGGLEPLCSQAFGAKRLKPMGYTLQKGILLLLATSIPISFIWFKVEFILVTFGQDPSIIKVAKSYLRFLVPDLVAISLLYPIRIFLRCQCITTPLMFCFAVAILLHIPLTFFLAIFLKKGVQGAAMATCVTDFNLVLMLTIYIYKSGIGKKTWNGVSSESITGWMPLLKLAIPSCLMTCLEWWCYEIMVLLTGRLPNAKEEVAVMTILLNGDTLFYALESALAASVSTRVGNELGANCPLGAYHSTIVSLGLSIGVALVPTIWLTPLRSIWGKLFTSNKKIVLGVGKIAPLVGLMEICNFPQIVSCGVLQGSGRLKMGAFVYLGVFYLLGLPLGICLAFVARLQLFGLWVGLLMAVLTCAIITATIVMRTDWIQQALHAQDLVSALRDAAMEGGLCLKDNDMQSIALTSKMNLCLKEGIPLISFPPYVACS